MKKSTVPPNPKVVPFQVEVSMGVEEASGGGGGCGPCPPFGPPFGP